VWVPVVRDFTGVLGVLGVLGELGVLGVLGELGELGVLEAFYSSGPGRAALAEIGHCRSGQSDHSGCRATTKTIVCRQ
jgi:hypothetical protein